ncbi:HIG1 domain family member 2A, mitochondrial-like [Argonauta hians]
MSSDQPNVKKEDIPDFRYLPPPKDIIFGRYEEGLRDKLVRKTKENPAVPFGLALTSFALSYGIWQMRTGNQRKSQLMMRLRIFGQGFTVVAILAGVLYSARQKKT